MSPDRANIATQGEQRVALKKSDLYSSLWKSCDELRGGMDASRYKDTYSDNLNGHRLEITTRPYGSGPTRRGPLAAE